MTLWFAVTFGTFFLMDFVAYATHRWVMHGPLWILHESHHLPRKGWFEANDFFSGFFAAVAILSMFFGRHEAFSSPLFAFGTGMTLYGFAYFFVHDVFTHRRVRVVDSKVPYLITVRAAHRIHHQLVGKAGQEPYGFLWFRM
jgi:beta-carotene 3-hydroxylase